MDSSTLHPKEVILLSYLHPTDVTSEVNARPRSQLSNVRLPELCPQGRSQPCTGQLFGHEVSKVRASVERDKCEEWRSLAKLDVVTCQFLTKSKIIKKQTSQIQIHNKAASTLV